MPLEHCTFRAVRLHACTTLRLCHELQLPFAALSHQDASDKELVGTAVEVERLLEVPAGGLEAHLVGAYPIHVGRQEVVAYRGRGDEAIMVNAVAVQRLHDSSVLPYERCMLLRARVLDFVRQSRPDVARGDVPADLSHFSWWAASRLPLPPLARAPMLRIAFVEERLSICATVLALFAKQTDLPLRAKL